LVTDKQALILACAAQTRSAAQLQPAFATYVALTSSSAAAAAAAVCLLACRLLRIEILLTVATFALAIYNLVAGVLSLLSLSLP
jgi:hypothetical protein